MRRVFEAGNIMLISAVICTYNRKALLERQVAVLCAMRGADSPEFEVVYVDNNSKDGTWDELTRLCAGRSQFRYFLETQQGSSFARNRGAREAHGEYLWFLDDDSLTDEGALQAYSTALPQWRLEVATGPILPRAETPVPWWFDVEAKQFNAYLARTDLGPETKLIERGHAWGPNMVIRKDALETAGGFSKDLGVFGDRRGGGEEDELQNRIFKAGGRLLYVHNAKVVHLILPKQMVFRQYMKQRFDRGGSQARDMLLRGQPPDNPLKAAASIAAHAAVSGALGLTGRISAAVDHLGACYGLYGRWVEGRRWSRRES